MMGLIAPVDETLMAICPYSGGDFALQYVFLCLEPTSTEFAKDS